MATQRKKSAKEPIAEVQVDETVKPVEVVQDSGKDKTVVRETRQQMSIFGMFIYNVVNKDAEIVVENLGYGDVYVNVDEPAKVGVETQRILFKESKTFKGVEKLYFTSGSQPTIQILEVK
jgi:hypothetical protein